MVERLNAMKGVSCLTPKGTFYTFPNISGLKKGSLELAADLLETVRIAVVPGVAFGRDANIRMAFADSEENLEEGLNRLEKYIDELSGKG